MGDSRGSGEDSQCRPRAGEVATNTPFSTEAHRPGRTGKLGPGGHIPVGTGLTSSCCRQCQSWGRSPVVCGAQVVGNR